MCGIVGMMSYGTRMWQVDFNIFTQLFHVNSLRGMDGAGVFGVNSDGKKIVVRMGAPAHSLIASDSYRDLIKYVDKGEVYMMWGHNRLATKGKKITAHSHPFTHGKITLIHNGTIDSFGKYRKEADAFDVDSEACCFLINKYGVEDVVEELSGAWAFIYYDSEKKTLSILKNDKRPLFISQNPNTKLLAFASESDMLVWVLGRNWGSFGKPYEVPNNTLLTYEIKEEKPKAKKLKGRGVGSGRIEKAEVAAETSGFVNPDHFVGDLQTEMELPPLPVRAPYVPPVSSYPSPSGGKVSYLPGPKKPQGGNGHWKIVDFVRDITEGKEINVFLKDLNPITEDRSAYLFEAASDDYPEITFYINVASQSEAIKLMDADGICGKVAVIHRSYSPLTQWPHKVFLHDPLPIYESGLPDSIKDSQILHTGE